MLGKLSNEELLSSLDRLVEREKKLGAQIVAHLCEVERRQLHLAMGHSSLCAYSVERLGMSEDVAYKRIQVARSAARTPEPGAAR